MSAIQKGDLVMVVRWTHKCKPGKGEGMPKPHGIRIGTPFVVEFVYDSATCPACKRQFSPAAAITRHGKTYGLPFSWLLKIDPPALDETTHTPEEITA